MCLRRLTPGRHGLTSANLSRPKTWCLLVFVLVALPPPPVYVLDNEVRPESDGVATPGLITSRGAPSRFYPRGPGSTRRHLPCAGLSASAGASVAATFAACRCPQTEVFPPQSADPLAGPGCRNNRDGSRTIRTRPEAVKTFFQKNFRANFP